MSGWVAGATIVGAGISAYSSNKAANTQAAAANKATDTQKAMYDQTQSNLSPFIGSGTTALNTLNGDLANGTLGGSFTNADLNANMAPNYAFQLKQGQQALENSQAADSGVLSGAALKGMQDYTQNTAAGAYQNAYNNWMSSQNMKYNQLSNLAGLGENAAAGLGNNGASISNGMANTITGAGNALAAGQIGQANAISGGINNALGYYQMNQLMGKMGTNNGGGSSGSTPIDPSNAPG